MGEEAPRGIGQDARGGGCDEMPKRPFLPMLPPLLRSSLTLQVDSFLGGRLRLTCPPAITPLIELEIPAFLSPEEVAKLWALFPVV